MVVELKGLFNFNLKFPKKGSGLPYNDKYLNGPNEQLWIRECILKDFLMNNKKWSVYDKTSKYEKYLLIDIKIDNYEIINNQYEIWNITLKK
jgi:hypothetical protein